MRVIARVGRALSSASKLARSVLAPLVTPRRKDTVLGHRFASLRWRTGVHHRAGVMRFVRRLSSCSRHVAHTPVAVLLGLEVGAPKDALRRAYLQRIKELHPDSSSSGKDPTEFIQLQQSWEQFEKVGARGGRSSWLQDASGQYEETVTFDVETVSTRKDALGRPAEDCVWTAQHMEAMRSSVLSAVQSASRQLLEGEELAAPTLRRCEPSQLRPGALNIHLTATGPWHRNRLAATLGSDDGTTFAEHLSVCFAAAGGRNLKLRLKGHVRWHTSGGGSQRTGVRE